MPRHITIPEARPLLRNARRLCIFGTSGGGKSTLSMRLSERLDLPHISLDRDVRWLPGWEIRDRAEQRARTEAFVSGERWIIDGTSISSFDLRLPRSDLVIWMRPPRWRAMINLARRVTHSYGQVRPDMADGCPEQLPDREFLSYIWHFERDQTPRILRGLEARGPAALPLLILRSHRETNDLLSGL